MTLFRFPLTLSLGEREQSGTIAVLPAINHRYPRHNLAVKALNHADQTLGGPDKSLGGPAQPFINVVKLSELKVSALSCGKG